MHYRKLGRSGLHVAPLSVGASNFGWKSDEPESHLILDTAFASGLNHIDTADAYSSGESEAIIGRWLAQDRSRRDKMVISTKVYYDVQGSFAAADPSFESWPNSTRLSAKHIRNACDASLRRLQTDHIDIYQMHQYDSTTPWEEIWQAMDILVREGKVLYVGGSNFAAWHLCVANEAGRDRGSLGIVSTQTHYNLMTRAAELEVLPACDALGIGMFAYSPLGHGLLGGVLAPNQQGSDRRSLASANILIDRYRDRIERWEMLCKELSIAPASVALAWLLNRTSPVIPVTGPRTAAQLIDSIRALDVQLPEEAIVQLDEIWPGPGGPAPDAYRGLPQPPKLQIIAFQ